MIRLPRLSLAVALTCSMAFPMLYGSQREAWAQEAVEAPAAETAAPAEAEAQPAAAQEAPAEEAPAAEAPAEAAPAEEMPAEAPAAEAAPADAAPADAAAAPADAAPPAEDVTPADAPLRSVVEAFLHYGQIGRYDVAAIQGKKILDSGKPADEVLAAFEGVMSQRTRDRRGAPTLEKMLDTFAGIDQTKDVSLKLRDVLNQARVARMSQPAFIDQAIQDLITNERAYSRAVALLRQSGELAVPQMVDYLSDSTKSQYHARIQRALVDMGRQALNPLVASLDIKNPDALVMIAGVMGDLGFDSTVPYLVDLRSRPGTNAAVQEAIDVALRDLRVSNTGSAGDLYYDLSQKFYYETSTILADKRYPNAFVWYVGGKGLERKEVPHAVFNEVMAMRTARRALELGTAQNAQSLWLAANYKREAQLPQGATDPTAPADSAHFYGVDSGTQYLNAVLARSITDRDAAVSLRAIKSLQEIVGRSNLFAGDAGQPILDGMRSSDRLVRFESAFAVAAALPEGEFPSQERVVPLLAEALSQTGTTNVLVVGGTDDTRNKLVSELAGFGLAGATGGDAAINEAATLPSVDVIVLTADVADEDVTRLLGVAGENPRLDRAAKIVVREKRGLPIERQYLRRKDVIFTDAGSGAGLTKLIEGARSRTAGAPLEQAIATDYALRATKHLGAIAKAKGATSLKVDQALQTLLNATADPRPEVAKEVGGVLAWVNDPQVQPALLSVAADEKTPAEVRVALFTALAGNAKTFGNQLDAKQQAVVQNTAQKGDSPELRTAAGSASGALNLPGEQAKRLILDWKVDGTPAAPAQAAVVAP